MIKQYHMSKRTYFNTTVILPRVIFYGSAIDRSKGLTKLGTLHFRHNLLAGFFFCFCFFVLPTKIVPHKDQNELLE